MTKFYEQMDRIHHDKVNYYGIYPEDDWEKEDYKEMFKYITKGYLVQHDHGVAFVINEEWDWGDDDEIYTDILSDDE